MHGVLASRLNAEAKRSHIGPIYSKVMI
jgi:hypothetical protein